MTYKYQTGEDVRLGDEIYYPVLGHGRITYMLHPNTSEAISWGLPDGAVLGGFGGADVSISFPDPSDDEDLVLISRMERAN